jgi:hypothetical protein
MEPIMAGTPTVSYLSAPSLVLDTHKVPGRVSLYSSVSAYLNYIVYPATTSPNPDSRSA